MTLNLIRFFLILSFLNFTHSLQGQRLENLTYKELMAEQQRRYLIGKCLESYAQYASLLDNLTENVSPASVKKFKKLFMSNAKVWNDLAVEPRMELCSDYVGAVYLNMRKNGVKVKFKEQYSYLEKEHAMKTDSSREAFYQEKIELKKILYNGLDAQHHIVQYPNGRVFYLQFEMYVDEKANKAYIMNILPSKKKDLP
jgi:hypothetical protein